MRPTGMGVAWYVCASACECVCWSQLVAVLKQINQSRCYLGCGLRWAQGTMVPRSLQVKWQIWGSGLNQSYSLGGRRDATFHYQYLSNIQ